MQQTEPTHSAPKHQKVSKLVQREVFSFFFASTLQQVKGRRKKKKQASSNSPVPLCTCWIPALEDKACSGGIAAQRRSSTRAEKSASSPPSGAVVVHRQAGFGAAVCGAQCRESHGCRIRGDFSLNRLWFLCSPKVFFLHIHSFFFLQPRADNTTRYHVTLNPFSAASTQNRWWWLCVFSPTCGFHFINTKKPNINCQDENIKSAQFPHIKHGEHHDTARTGNTPMGILWDYSKSITRTQ